MERPERADSAAFDRLLRALAAARLPGVPPSGPWGLDGTTYELGLGDGFACAEYRWWHAPPNGWEPLAEFVHGLVALGDQAAGPKPWY